VLEFDIDSAVPDWIVEYPQTLVVFQEFGIDYCYGGKSLDFACKERCIPAATILARIRQVVGRHEGRPATRAAALLASIQVGLPR
jgi:iron-sulfur cluster repair protein YtfE (RIC family)